MKLIFSIYTTVFKSFLFTFQASLRCDSSGLWGGWNCCPEPARGRGTEGARPGWK